MLKVVHKKTFYETIKINCLQLNGENFQAIKKISDFKRSAVQRI